MARRGGFIERAIREGAKQQRRREMEKRREIRAYAQAARHQQRMVALQEKANAAAYTAARMQEVSDANQDIATSIDELNHILEATLQHDDTITLETLKMPPFQPFTPPGHLLLQVPTPPHEAFLVPAPTKMALMIPGAKQRYQKRIEEANNQYNAAVAAAQNQEQQRQHHIASLYQQHEQERQAYDIEAKEHNDTIDELASQYALGDPDAVIAYNIMVLERSLYPADFPQQFQLAYIPESKELVIEYELPGVECIPSIAEYKYVKSRDAVDEKRRKDAEVRELYQDVIAAVCLRTLHEVFEADQYHHLQVVVFNGFVHTVNRSTGQDIRPHLLSIRVIRDRFMSINLARVEKRACLKDLGVSLSPRPTELVPVKPVVEFNMVDKRFIDQGDILGALDTRPNVMDLTPSEFEQLVSNLFTKMGFETKLTRSSRDGGVDAVAFDTRPIVGGKLVIQAKRYKHTVGVSSVRDLYGTMQHEGANKGILVATSGYGPDAFDFVRDKPIELIDGSRLLYLLDQVGIKAKIEIPA